MAKNFEDAYGYAKAAIAKLDAYPLLRSDIQVIYEAGLRAVNQSLTHPVAREWLLSFTRPHADRAGYTVADFLPSVLQFDTALQGTLLWLLNKNINIPALRSEIGHALTKLVPWFQEMPVPSPTAATQEFAQQGIIDLPQLVDPNQAAEMMAYLDTCDKGRDHTTLQHTLTDVLNMPHAFRIATDERVLDLVHGFLGAPPTAVHMDAWWSLAESEEPWGAQVFHRDTDDFLACKLFVYLNDVAADNGPHIFVRGSHRTEVVSAALAANNNTGDVHDYFSGNGRVMSGTIDKVFGTAVTEITGRAGTSFLANTYCFHRGKIPKFDKRCIFQIAYGTIVYPERVARWMDGTLIELPADCAKGERATQCMRFAPAARDIGAGRLIELSARAEHPPRHAAADNRSPSA